MAPNYCFVAEKSVISILSSLYGLEVESISNIGSYFNVNYLVKTRLSRKIQPDQIKYIVKIINTNSDSFFDNIDLQQHLMEHLKMNDVGCPVPLKTIKGNAFVKGHGEDSCYLLQLLSFLPGQSITSVSASVEDLNEIFYNVGIHMARFHQASKTLKFDCSSMSSNFLFRPENAFQICGKIDYVSDKRVKRSIEKHMESFRRNFLPRVHELRKGFIHGDFSESNVIVKKRNPGPKSAQENLWHVTGIIDFEHCHYGYIIGELGISIAYHMTKSVSTPASDIITSTRHIINGYQSMNPLTLVEKELLFDAVVSRLGVSYVSGCYNSSLYPEKKDLFMMQSKHIPQILDILDKMEKKKIISMWFENE
uniref:hydroxylysine kinase-like n=1 Tax=Styela clava TaxID=7725 RepID=UPI001939469A|nr:hydroxylysine kinase-like [Styela clava]